MFQGEVCSISRTEISHIIYSLQMINRISDDECGDAKKKKDKNTKSLYHSLHLICQFTEIIENHLLTLTSYDMRILRDQLKAVEKDLAPVFPAIQSTETTEDIIKILKSLPFSKDFQESFTR